MLSTSFNSRIPSGTDSWRFCAGCLSLWEFICVSVFLIWRVLFLWGSSATPTHSISSAGLSGQWREGCNGDIPFRAGCSEAIYSLFDYCLAMDTCICSHLLQEKDSLMIVEHLILILYSRVSLRIMLLLIIFVLFLEK